MKTKHPDNAIAAFALALLCVLAVLFSGCASFQTSQSDSTTSTNGVVRSTTTEASARTLLASKQALNKWKASQSEKTQGASVGGLEQESDASKLIDSLTAMAQAIGALQAGPAAGLLNRRSVVDAPQFVVPEGYYLAPLPAHMRGPTFIRPPPSP